MGWRRSREQGEQEEELEEEVVEEEGQGKELDNEE